MGCRCLHIILGTCLLILFRYFYQAVKIHNTYSSLSIFVAKYYGTAARTITFLATAYRIPHRR
ncbi:hypothetical protein F4818DRAFT_409363 [Hypoxylon cercidicola]|nr:hypothetical protein F4818DRAFT_409363 [Hypoxylon cercidicola]